MAEIVLANITKSYPDGAIAVRDLSLTIADGEFIILVGPSGCGKSTTLNMIAGLEDITSGDLLIDGKRVNDLAPRDRDIAMVFQSYALYPHMTVRQNIAFPLTLQKGAAKLAKSRIAEKVAEVAAILDLGDLLDRKPSQLSGGQRQRVAMGRAIVRHPKAFLMDEPLSNLDAKLRVQMRGEIARLQRRLSTTTVYVTHDQTEAMTLGDRVVVMYGGVAQQIGTPDELYQRPANLFVAGFVGSPAMNFFAATLAAGVVRLPFVEVPLSPRLTAALDARPTPERVVIGVRPEHVCDAESIRRRHNAMPVCFRADVDLVESLGADKYVYFTTGGSTAPPGDDDRQWVARVAGTSPITVGRSADLALDAEEIAIFDADTGINLTASVPAA